ncbi:hypothetical protein DUNSADRAFT_1998 [Dunaliella salina]|uniref:Uncharacterized protein n=1 Tax=Dunaliella salina TaxID=3046 RepID=A0ABQ7GWC1_DUNSA|nr:hypothetical protein DUNSADRAFT_1998 [Dunaliella salina]|eukprot:KAF5838907.1 hypothetical protein DUNSADRAFT_1998 [Dunaliella salina]
MLLSARWPLPLRAQAPDLGSVSRRKPVWATHIPDVRPNSADIKTRLGALPSTAQLQSLLGPSPEDQREFDTLWSEYARELELSKEASNAIALQARQGRLVCDANFLRARALKLMAVCGKVPGLNPRNVLSQSSLTLRYSPHKLASAARRLSVLLPEHDVTATLVTVMAHLDLGPDILASYLLELESVFCPCFYGAAVPPLVFAFFVSEQLELKAQADDSRDAFESEQLELEAQASNSPAESGPVSSSLNGQHTGSGAQDAGVDSGQGGGIGGTPGDSPAEARAVDAPWSSDKREDRIADCEEEGEQNGHEDGSQEEPRRQLDTSQENKTSRNSDREPPSSEYSGSGSWAIRTQSRQATIPDPGILMDDDEGTPGEDESSPLTRQPLDLVQILVRLRGLVSVLGAEVAHAGLSRTPRIMLGVGTEQAQASRAALQDVLRINGALAARMLETRGKLTSMDPSSVQPQLSALTIALGWPKSRVRLLCLEEPLMLLRTPSSVGRLWRRLQRAARQHRAWADTLAQAPVDYLAMLMRLPRPDEALARMDFLSQGRGRLRVPPLERILRTPLGAFLREFPEYSTWRH